MCEGCNLDKLPVLDTKVATGVNFLPDFCDKHSPKFCYVSRKAEKIQIDVDIIWKFPSYVSQLFLSIATKFQYLT